MEQMLAYRRHQAKAFWINIFLKIREELGIDYDSLRAKEVVEFFYLMKEFEQKLKLKTNAASKP